MVVPSTVDIPSLVGADIFAATRVVKADGTGTDTTLAAAIAALPASGGTIYMEEIETITVGLVIDKHVRIIGKGSGELTTEGSGIICNTASVTIFDRTANVEVILEDLRITGTGDGDDAQIFFEADRGDNAPIHFRNVVVGDRGSSVGSIATMFRWTGAGASPEVFAIDSTFSVAVNGSPNIFLNSSGTSEFEFVRSHVRGDAGVTGGGDVILKLVDSSFIFDGTGWTVFFTSSGSNVSSVDQVVNFRDCRVSTTNFLSIIATLADDDNLFAACHFSGSAVTQARLVDIPAGNDRNRFSSCHFRYDGVPSAAAEFIRVAGVDNGFVNCTFLSNNGDVARCIDLLAAADRTQLSNNQYADFSAEAVRVASDDCRIGGGSGEVVTETGSANENRYHDIDPTSTIIGAASIVEDWNTRAITTTPVTLDTLDRTALVNATGGVRVVNLPTAASARYHVYTIKKTDVSANTVTVDASGAETIDGATTQVLDTQFAFITIQSDGSMWNIISSSIGTVGADDGNPLVVRADPSTGPSEVTTGDLLAFELTNGATKAVLLDSHRPVDMSLVVNPVIHFHFVVTNTGSGNGNVRFQLAIKYIADGELTTKANDETLLATVAVINTLNEHHSHTFTLDVSLITAADRHFSFKLERLGADVLDTYDGAIGILTASTLVFTR